MQYAPKGDLYNVPNRSNRSSKRGKLEGISTRNLKFGKCQGNCSVPWTIYIRIMSSTEMLKHSTSLWITKENYT